MRVIRQQVRSLSSPELSVAQFRALAFIGRNTDVMLSDVATFLAQPLPTVSKLVDGLVAAGLCTREIGSPDRRRVSLSLTTSGRRKYEEVLRSAEAYLSGPIGKLSAPQRAEIHRSMQTLSTIFLDPPETAPRGRKSESQRK